MKTTRFWLMCAAFTMGGLSAWAGPVARIGETDYATLDEAVAVGGEIRLLADVTLDSLLVPSDAEVTIDLAGHSLTGTQQDRATVVVNGSLTVDDSVGGGRITHEGAVVISTKMTSYASAIYNDGELSLLGGVICAHLLSVRLRRSVTLLPRRAVAQSALTGASVSCICSEEMYAEGYDKPRIKPSSA